MPSVKCSHPDCRRQLTGKLDTYGTHDAPLCYEHWRDELNAIKIEFDQEVEARVMKLSQAARRLPGMEMECADA